MRATLLGYRALVCCITFECSLPRRLPTTDTLRETLHRFPPPSPLSSVLLPAVSLSWGWRPRAGTGHVLFRGRIVRQKRFSKHEGPLPPPAASDSVLRRNKMIATLPRLCFRLAWAVVVLAGLNKLARAGMAVLRRQIAFVVAAGVLYATTRDRYRRRALACRATTPEFWRGCAVQYVPRRHLAPVVRHAPRAVRHLCCVGAANYPSPVLEVRLVRAILATSPQNLWRFLQIGNGNVFWQFCHAVPGVMRDTLLPLWARQSRAARPAEYTAFLVFLGKTFLDVDPRRILFRHGPSVLLAVRRLVFALPPDHVFTEALRAAGHVARSDLLFPLLLFNPRPAEPDANDNALPGCTAPIVDYLVYCRERLWPRPSVARWFERSAAALVRGAYAPFRAPSPHRWPRSAAQTPTPRVATVPPDLPPRRRRRTSRPAPVPAAARPRPAQTPAGRVRPTLFPAHASPTPRLQTPPRPSLRSTPGSRATPTGAVTSPPETSGMYASKDASELLHATLAAGVVALTTAAAGATPGQRPPASPARLWRTSPFGGACGPFRPVRGTTRTDDARGLFAHVADGGSPSTWCSAWRQVHAQEGPGISSRALTRRCPNGLLLLAYLLADTPGSDAAVATALGARPADGGGLTCPQLYALLTHEDRRGRTVLTWCAQHAPAALEAVVAPVAQRRLGIGVWTALLCRPSSGPHRDCSAVDYLLQQRVLPGSPDRRESSSGRLLVGTRGRGAPGGADFTVYVPPQACPVVTWWATTPRRGDASARRRRLDRLLQSSLWAMARRAGDRMQWLHTMVRAIAQLLYPPAFYDENCPICYDGARAVGFEPCGHQYCISCSLRISRCSFCRARPRRRAALSTT